MTGEFGGGRRGRGARACEAHRSVVRVSDHSDRAAGVHEAVLADGAEQHPAERAVAAAADDQQLRGARGVDQRFRGIPFHDLA